MIIFKKEKIWCILEKSKQQHKNKEYLRET
jgi:hypothetical protein